MVPRCEVSSRCHGAISAELDRVSPCEGFVVPLVSLETRDRLASPCSMIGLDDIERLVIAEVVVVPAERQVNRRFSVAALPGADRVVNGRIEGLVARFPRLRACAYLHSHPFAIGGTRPSAGEHGDEGHLAALLARNLEAGLGAAFTFIASPGANGAWRIEGFALDRTGELVDLGETETVDDRGPSVRRARTPSLYERPAIRSMLRRWRRALARRRLRFEVSELFGGALRTVVELDARTSAVLLLPLDYPDRPPCLYRARRGEAEAWPVEVAGREASGPDGWLRALERAVGPRAVGTPLGGGNLSGLAESVRR